MDKPLDLATIEAQLEKRLMRLMRRAAEYGQGAGMIDVMQGVYKEKAHEEKDAIIAEFRALITALRDTRAALQPFMQMNIGNRYNEALDNTIVLAADLSNGMRVTLMAKVFRQATAAFAQVIDK